MQGPGDKHCTVPGQYKNSYNIKNKSQDPPLFSIFRSIRAEGGFLRLAISPFGDGVMDLLTGKGFSLVRFLKAIPNKISAEI
uniref:Putative ovule protein n=1 Tax=Solanum chacoense TaxID=4108 RepID=A0A0V0GVS1_SOLCH